MQTTTFPFILTAATPATHTHDSELLWFTTLSHGGLSPLNRVGVTGAQKGTLMKRHCFTSYPFFALIGLILSPLAAHTSSSSTGQSNEPISTFYASDGNSITSVFFSPDGRLLALEVEGTDDPSNDPSKFKLWDVSAGQSIANFTPRMRDGWWNAAFSPDGRLLTLGGGSNGAIELWDVSRGAQHVAMISTSAHESYDDDRGNGISALSFSPDGRLLASGGRSDFLVKLWDVSRREHIATIDSDGKGGTITSVVFSPDGRLLAYWKAGDARIKLWDVSRREHVATISAHEDDAFDGLSFSSDGSLLASAGSRWSPPGVQWSENPDEGDEIKEVKVWDVSTGQSIATLEGSPPVSFSPKGRVLASASANKIRWVWEWNEDGSGSGSGSHSGGKNIELWDVSTGQSIATLPLSGDLKDRNEQPRALVFSPDGRLLASQFWNAVQLWDVSEWIPQARLTPDPTEVQFSADDPVWQTFTVHTNLDSVLVRANPAGSDPAIEIVGGQQVPTRDFCPAEGNDRPTSGRRDGWSLHVKACQAGQTKILLIDYGTGEVLQQYEVNVEASTSSSDGEEEEADEPQARLTPDPAEVEFSADDPAWKTFTVHTNLDSVLVRANPAGSDPAIEVSGGQQAPTRDFCPAEGNDRPTSGRRDGWSLHVKACQAGQTKILLIDYDTGEVLQQYEVNVEASTGTLATTVLNPSYPNPFNSETTLSYTLPTASDIRLEVFTLSGQRVAILHEGFQAAGYHTIAIDASALASGVYLYRLTTPEGHFTQKFTLLR